MIKQLAKINLNQIQINIKLNLIILTKLYFIDMLKCCLL